MFNLIVPDNLQRALANFPSIFQNIIFARDDIGTLMIEYEEKEGHLTHARTLLITSCFVEIGTINTPLLLCYPGLRMLSKKNYRFVQHTQMKCFNGFVPSAVNARGENSNSGAVAQTRRLLANSSIG